jgi:2'-5' RNA ligase
MRLFVAVETGAEWLRRRPVAEFALRRTARTARDLVGRDRTRPSDARFIGEVPPSEADAIGKVLERGVPMLPFPVEVGGLAEFPARGPARVLWVGLSSGIESMVKLESLVSGRLAEAGVPADTRPFHPHVTLARVRDAAGLRTAPLFNGLTDATLGSVQVSGYTLFESRATPRGVEYVALARTRLACQPVG